MLSINTCFFWDVTWFNGEPLSYSVLICLFWVGWWDRSGSGSGPEGLTDWEADSRGIWFSTSTKDRMHPRETQPPKQLLQNICEIYLTLKIPTAQAVHTVHLSNLARSSRLSSDSRLLFISHISSSLSPTIRFHFKVSSHWDSMQDPMHGGVIGVSYDKTSDF